MVCLFFQALRIMSYIDQVQHLQGEGEGHTPKQQTKGRIGGSTLNRFANEFSRFFTLFEPELSGQSLSRWDNTTRQWERRALMGVTRGYLHTESPLSVPLSLSLFPAWSSYVSLVAFPGGVFCVLVYRGLGTACICAFTEVASTLQEQGAVFCFF